MLAVLEKIALKMVLAPIYFYQFFISPLLGNNCRFHPNCSAYAVEAAKTHGAVYGSILIIRRLLKCHPFGKSGFDPVPEKSVRGKSSMKSCGDQRHEC